MADYSCMTCHHWHPRDRSADYSAPCAQGYGSTPFNHTCVLHSGRATVSDAIAQQSAVRGDIVQMWRQRTGLK